MKEVQGDRISKRQRLNLNLLEQQTVFFISVPWKTLIKDSELMYIAEQTWERKETIKNSTVSSFFPNPYHSLLTNRKKE